MAKKKVITRKIPKTGLNGVPFDKGFFNTLQYFQYQIEKRDIGEIVKTYIKNNYKKSDSKAILANSDWRFSAYTHYGCVAYWINTKQEPHCKYYSSDTLNEHFVSFKKYLDDLIEPGKKLLIEKELNVKENNKVVTLSPMQRLQNKIGDTIIQDLLNLEDEWIDGKETTLDVYNQFKLYGLGGSATLPVRTMIEGWLLDYEDAFHKRCDQAVEGYSHLKKSELGRRIEACNNMIGDLDKIKLATRAMRKVKVKRPRSADKQVARLHYKKEDTEFKLVSINPIQVIGSVLLYTFNTKYKTLTEYIAPINKTFEISGSTLKNFSKENSRTIKLRKPEVFLSLVMKKTQNQIDKEWKTLTTKTNPANGRINKETILLRVK